MFSSTIRACLVAGLLVACPSLGSAKSFTIPDPNPVAVVTMPDDWESTEIAKGVESMSEDEKVYVAVEVTELKDVAKAVADSIIWLKSKDVEIDRATQNQRDITINGMTGVQVKWDGKDEDGPTHVSLTVLSVTDTKGLILTYWASPEGEKENLKELSDIIDSLKPVK
jgi:hypothetical protein